MDHSTSPPKDQAQLSLEESKLTLTRIISELGNLGSSQSRLAIAANNLQASHGNFESARARIEDVDTATESAHLLKTNILQQASTAILSQANLLPSLALRLLQGVP